MANLDAVVLEQYRINLSNSISLNLVEAAFSLNVDKLDKDDLKKILNSLSEGLKIANSENRKAFQDDKKITEDQYKKVRDSLTRIGNLESELLVATINSKIDSILTDENTNAKEKILTATAKLNEANSRLQEFDNFLKFLGEIGNLFAVVFAAIQAPSIASISAILQRLSDLG